MKGNEHGQLAADTIYALLVDSTTGEIVVSATLEYILQKIRDDNLLVENAEVEREWCRGAECSTVRITKI
ncbi:MAG TPA: hypothetical protein VIC02_03830 [Kineobactrum sp.]